MSSETQFLGNIDRFEESSNGVYAIIEYWEEGNFGEGAGVLSYAHHLLPEHGTYGNARYDVAVTITTSPQQIDNTIEEDVSVVEFETELAETLPDHYRVKLFEVPSDQFRGYAILTRSYLPSWFDEETTGAHISFHLKYNHNRTKKEAGYSEEKIKSLRGQGQRMYNEYFS